MVNGSSHIRIEAGTAAGTSVLEVLGMDPFDQKLPFGHSIMVGGRTSEDKVLRLRCHMHIVEPSCFNVRLLATSRDVELALRVLRRSNRKSRASHEDDL